MSEIDLTSFTETVLQKHSEVITDSVFLLIQNDHALMHDYLLLVEKLGLGNVNRNIGRAVKQKLGLTNSPSREKQPISTLIKSYQIFE